VRSLERGLWGEGPVVLGGVAVYVGGAPGFSSRQLSTRDRERGHTSPVYKPVVPGSLCLRVPVSRCTVQKAMNTAGEVADGRVLTANRRWGRRYWRRR
jgi:hypothetical protein